MPAQSTTKPLEFEGWGCLPWPVIHPGARASPPATLFLQAGLAVQGHSALQGKRNPPLQRFGTQGEGVI